MPIRVLVVEDSLTIRKRLVEVLSAEPGMEVVGEAGDGKRGIELCQALRPDVITLDMMLPVMTGLAATEYIMAYQPTPILIVSASTNRGEVFHTYDALAAGAVDVLEKPTSIEPGDAWARRLVDTVKLVSRIPVISHPRGRLQARRRVVPIQSVPSSLRAVAMGASTGGPSALVEALRALPADYPLPILLVLHLPTAFSASFAEWLDGQTPVAVRCAEDGEPLPRQGEGGVLMAPADRHMVIEGDRIRLIDGVERHSCRPSVDVLFESVARELGPDAAGVLLTGMGRDGAQGLLAIRRSGGITFAQDEATSVVFGMPGAAIELGGASHVLPLDRIGPSLAVLASRAAA